MEWYAWLLICVVMVMVTARVFRSVIYDVLIVNMTKGWYREVLIRVGENHHMLDVGVGTGSALLANRGILEANNVKVTGIDYDANYIHAANKNITRGKLNELVVAVQVSVYDYGGARLSDSNMDAKAADVQDYKFDSAYFSGSLMIMPDPVKALIKVSSLVKPGGIIYITQTFQQKPSKWLEVLKPLLKYFTTVDFGQVTYEHLFLEHVKQAGMLVTTRKCLGGPSDRQHFLIALERDTRNQ